MRPFNVLDPQEDIHKSAILEASAGTGKTFAIENIVARKLVEGDLPLTLDQILVVTFTDAAVVDLRQRIYKKIRKEYDDTRDIRLDDALQTFHEASISTIHGFCSKMIREVGIEGGVAVSEIGNLPNSLYTRLVTDFIQVVFNTEHYSIYQIEALKQGYAVEKLVETLSRATKCGLPAQLLPPLKEQQERLMFLWEQLGSDPKEKIRSVFLYYNKLKHADTFLDAFPDAPEFDDFFCLGESVLIFLHPVNWKKKIEHQIELPKEIDELREAILNFSNRKHLFSDLVEKCRAHVENYCLKEDLTPFDLLLQKMEMATRNPDFAKKVREKYKIAIVDEFQDTDPVQWEIFHRLFRNDAQLILVGDPKQSIYGFRQADIYTYRKAAESLGHDSLRSLDTNYRSTPTLVDALNTLFDSTHTPGWIPLPRTSTSIPYHPVKAGREESSIKGGIRFITAEDEEGIMLAIANAIIQYRCPLNSTAILIKDRHQAKAIGKILQQKQIPFVLQKQELLNETEAWKDWMTLLRAVVQPKNQSLLKQALGTILIGFNHIDIRLFIENDTLPIFMDRFITLKTLWYQQGLSVMIEKLFSPSFLRDTSLKERLLSSTDGDLYLDHFTQIHDLFMEEETRDRLTPQELIIRGQELQALSESDEPRLLAEQDHVQEGVKILTIHSSKGLEYDVVFAPGLFKTVSFKEELIPLPTRKLVPFYNINEPAVVEHLTEIDAEKMRQLYVALTRAKTWLYIPFLPGKKSKIGEAPPLHLFLARMGQSNQLSSEELYNRIPSLTIETLRQILPSHPAITIESGIVDPTLIYSSNKTAIQLKPPTLPTIPGRSITVDSFTSLTQHQSKSKSSPKVSVPKDAVPAGTETGIVIHKIFEMIDYAAPQIAPFLSGTLLQSWSDVIDAWVRQALEYRFPENFTLADVSPQEQFREVEFLYPTANGYLKGVIDLIFHHRGKIHIVDWKSNLLADYSQESLKESMKEHDYFLQAQLYKEAARRYFGDLPIVIDYFFVRGSAVYRWEDDDVE